MYWFWDWMNENDVRDKQSLRRAIYRGTALDRFTALAPEPVIFERTSSPLECEITAGKGFDLTGGARARALRFQKGRERQKGVGFRVWCDTDAIRQKARELRGLRRLETRADWCPMHAAIVQPSSERHSFRKQYLTST
jgi:hypothetical protein